jgi:hypothetical protein
MLSMIDSIVKLSVRLRRLFSKNLILFTETANSFMKKILSKFEPKYLRLINVTKSISEFMSKKILRFVEKADPITFTIQDNMRGVKNG